MTPDAAAHPSLSFAPHFTPAVDEAGRSRLPSAALWIGGALLALGVAVPAVLMLQPPRVPVAAVIQPMAVDEKGVSLKDDAPQWRYVELAVAKDAQSMAPPRAPARIAFDEQRTSAVGTPLAGRVEKVLVRIGDRLEKGARLFSVRSGAWADLEREVATARANLLVKKRLVERARDLVAVKALAEKDLVAAEAELHEAELGEQAGNAKLDSLRVSPEASNLFWVLAPRKGTVVELDVWANQEATPEREKPLLRISDLDQLLVLADVQEGDAADIPGGGEVEVHTQASNLVRPGKVEHVSEVVDPSRRTVEVRVRVDNTDRALRPNGFAEIEFKTETKARRVRVPSEAVVTDGARSIVFVAQGPGRLERVQVKAGRQRDGEVELLEGLEPGSRYVAHGALLLLNQIELAQ